MIVYIMLSGMCLFLLTELIRVNRNINKRKEKFEEEVEKFKQEINEIRDQANNLISIISDLIEENTEEENEQV